METRGDLAGRLTYEDAVRVSAEQLAHVESIRSRAGLLLSVATISNSFLGSQALQRGGASALAWLSFCGFAVTSALCLAVLRPRAWELSPTPIHPLAEPLIDRQPDRAYLEGALRIREVLGKRGRGAESLGLLLGLASVSLGTNVILWLATVAAS